MISNLLENSKTHIYSPFLVSFQSQHSAETTLLETTETLQFLDKLQNNSNLLWGPVLLQLLKNIQFNLTSFWVSVFVKEVLNSNISYQRKISKGHSFHCSIFLSHCLGELYTTPDICRVCSLSCSAE